MKKIILVLVIIILIVLGILGINFLSKNNSNKSTSSTQKESFSFEVNNQEIKLGDDLLKLNLPEPLATYEIESCAFDGIEKTYTYENFEITTYPHDNKEEILSIYLLDAENSTKEGVKIGDSIDLMKEKYGDDFEKIVDSYVYKKGDSSITFITNNDIITNIEYSK